MAAVASDDASTAFGSDTAARPLTLPAGLSPSALGSKRSGCSAVRRSYALPAALAAYDAAAVTASTTCARRPDGDGVLAVDTGAGTGASPRGAATATSNIGSYASGSGNSPAPSGAAGRFAPACGAACTPAAPAAGFGAPPTAPRG
eukprot:213479-Chlamydomonas_euryale.AAC.1